MTTSRKQIRDNLEEAAANLLEYVSDEGNRDELIKDMVAVYEAYKAPMDKWLIGHFYQLYRTRAEEISLAKKKLEENYDDTDILEVIANYFKTGAWKSTSANTTLMLVLIDRLEKKYKYDANPLDIELIRRLNTLFIKNIHTRIKENLFFDSGRKNRESEIEDMKAHKSGHPEQQDEIEIVRSYQAPERRKIDFENNAEYKRVVTELNAILVKKAHPEAVQKPAEEVAKSYTPPARRKIRFGVNPENPDVDLSGFDEKLGQVFDTRPEQAPATPEASAARFVDEFTRFENYRPDYFPEESVPVAQEQQFGDLDLDALLAELEGTLTPPNPAAAAEGSASKEHFKSVREKMEKLFANTMKHRQELENALAIEAKEEEEIEDDVSEKSEAASEYSDSSELTDSSSDSSSDNESNASDDMSDKTDGEDDDDLHMEQAAKPVKTESDNQTEDEPEMEDEPEPELSFKERFAAAKKTLEKHFSTMVESRKVEQKREADDNWLAWVNVDDRLNDTAGLKPAEEEASPKKRFETASKNVSTLFGATLKRREQIERQRQQDLSNPAAARKYKVD